ncbi:hypothetical protein CRI70_19440, partial [Streptomyces sp. Ru87]
MNSDSRTEDRGRGGLEACAECGTPSGPDQSFCEGCGAVLRWAPSGGAAGRPGHSGPGGAAQGGGRAEGGPSGAPGTGAAPPPAAPAGAGAAHPAAPAAPAADLPDDEPTLRNSAVGGTASAPADGGVAQGG